MVYFFFSQQNTQKTDTTLQTEITVTPPQDSSTDQKAELTPVSGESRYIEYTPGILVQTGERKQVLFFYANWCPTCVPADENFRANVNRIPEDVVLIRVNYKDTDTDEQETGLAQHYGITYQHTFVQLDKEGNVVKKWNGGQIDELLASIQ